MLILCLFKFMNMNNLQSGLFFSLTGITAVASLSSCASQKKTEEQKPYNIVYIMTDDHTAQMMSCYDKRYMETPNLDRIANDGVRFTNSFVANSLSGPSRACMITGKHSCANKFYDNTTCIFDGSQQTFPKLLQQAGYQTALIGKWHLESLPTGFNYWEIVPGQGDYYNPDFITQDNDTIQKHGYITNLITDDAIDWMENKRDKDKPFCILIHHKAIHRNWLADTCNLSLYEDKTFPLPDNFFDDYEGRPAAAAQEMSIVKDMDMIYDLKMLRPDKQTRLKALYENYIGRMDEGQRAAWDKFYGPIIDDFYKKNPQGKELADWKFQRYMRDYMKTVKSLDDNVGRVLDYLKEKNMLDNTLVVYTSDQGFYMGEHGWFDKRFMYEESMHTPLIMRLPKGFDRKGDITELVQNIDKRYMETPNLDRIANDGVRFTNSFVANSLSGPSRACMITGKHSCANKFYDNTTCIFDGSQQTFPKLLQQAGYQTALIGKWHLESLPTGFNYWEIVPGQGDYYNPDFITQDNDTIQKHGYITNLITDDAIDWMENKRDKDKPFCILIHHKAIHRNWLADTCNLSLYEDKTFPLPDNFFDDYEGRPAAAAQEMSIVKDMDMIYDLKMLRPDKQTRLKALYENYIGRMDEGQRAAWDKFYGPIIDDFYKKNPQGKELADWKFQRYMRDYMKTVKSLDDNVGRVLDYLKEKNMLDNTLVVYTSDQGFYMGEHGWFDKRFMYEESMHTPLIMRLPKGFDRKGDITELVQNIDYAPTFLELAGAPVPEDIQGVSLLPLLKGEKPADWRKSLYYHFYEYPAEHMVKRHYGVRTERYKLIHFYNDIDVWELYDLQADPTEMHNLYGQKEYESVVTELKTELARLQEQYNDPVRFSPDRDKE